MEARRTTAALEFTGRRDTRAQDNEGDLPSSVDIDRFLLINALTRSANEPTHRRDDASVPVPNLFPRASDSDEQ